MQHFIHRADLKVVLPVHDLFIITKITQVVVKLLLSCITYFGVFDNNLNCAKHRFLKHLQSKTYLAKVLTYNVKTIRLLLKLNRK
jgi:hypothetical protein